MNPELLFFAVSSGLLAAYSPCSLPVYPVLLGILAKGDGSRKLRAAAFAAGLAFMFSLFYLAVGFALKLAGETVFESLEGVYAVIYAAAALVCLLFALQSTGKVSVFRMTFGFTGRAYSGVLGSFLTGVFFGTVVTPCNLPFILTGVLPVLLSKATVFEGLLLMFTFSLSLSLPVLAVGLVSGQAMDSPLRRHMKRIKQASTVFLLAAGLYFIYMVCEILSI